KALGARDYSGFRELAAKYSEDQASRGRGGELPWLERSTLGQPPGLIQAAFSLTEANSVSSTLETPMGLHILKLWERRPARRRSFAEAKREIQGRIYQE